ncbi:glycosyltransferase family 2 protein [Paludibaculum fermentans]|uniref:Glycosyltransferase n=1 Tax=Paludibaculum fermentans TaxID=1473598 RepID=A0A7S7SIR9_PALFE|nr:glycosyltransferase [Paludibaculum fermentans]QOY85210.1 glycosyltransferase [Paludibaculum fermentans]
MTNSSVQPDLRPLPLPPLARDPLVSILVANYNYARYLPDCLNSVLQQSYGNFEVLICDDGSTDDSLRVLAEFAASDHRIRFIAQPNGGMASALNRAYEQAKGQLIALIDADDTWHDSKLDRIVQAFQQNPAAGMVTHQLRAEDTDGRIVRRILPPRLDSGWLAPRCVNGECLRLPPCSALSVRSEVAKSIFPIPPIFRSSADRIVQERALLYSEVAAVPEVLAMYRVHGNNLTGLAGPLDSLSIQKTVAFLENVWKARAEFVCEIHGISLQPDRWRVAEGSEYQLALSLLAKDGKARPDVSLISDRKRRIAWSILTRLPDAIAIQGLRFWWRPNPVKRFTDSLSRLFS